MAEFNAKTWFAEDVATFGDRLEAAREAAGLTPGRSGAASGRARHDGARLGSR